MDAQLAPANMPRLSPAIPLSVKSRSERIGVVGLGYVGLPLAVALADVFDHVSGFDTNRSRIDALRRGDDSTHEVSATALHNSTLRMCDTSDDIADCSVYIVAVPTPVTKSNRPDLEPLLQTCRTLAPYLQSQNVVVFESTVFPGATRDVCVPELELYSGLTEGVDFHVGYSPERISPGDPVHHIQRVTKIVSASNSAVLERVAQLYERIVPAGVHRAPSIEVAEAAKVFENTQRDVNIALMNEFALICDKLDIRTRDVIRATGTKWNALPFTPGLVGGHCIGVDPFYLTTKAEDVGAYPEIMLASRRRNDGMSAEIVARILKFLAAGGVSHHSARVGIFGLTFKENVPDLRNSRVLDIAERLGSFGITPLLNDPLVNQHDLKSRGMTAQPLSQMGNLDLMLLAVPHAAYLGDEGRHIQQYLRTGGTLMDIKSHLEPAFLREDLTYWSL